MIIDMYGGPIANWNIEEMTGYKPLTTLYTDFSIADKFGTKGIQETFDKVFEEFKNNYKYFTELVMVMSWKSFEHQDNYEYCKLYSDLYHKSDEYAFKNLKGEELKYYIRTTD